MQKDFFSNLPLSFLHCYEKKHFTWKKEVFYSQQSPKAKAGHLTTPQNLQMWISEGLGGFYWPEVAVVGWLVVVCPAPVRTAISSADYFTPRGSWGRGAAEGWWAPAELWSRRICTLKPLLVAADEGGIFNRGRGIVLYFKTAGQAAGREGAGKHSQGSSISKSNGELTSGAPGGLCQEFHNTGCCFLQPWLPQLCNYTGNCCSHVKVKLLPALAV